MIKFIVREEIIHFANKWNSIGISTVSLKVEHLLGSKKLFKRIIPITEEVFNNPEILPDDFNFLAVLLKNSGIFCLDVEGIPGSMESFYSLLKDRKIDTESFIMEKTLNGGVHTYFRVPEIPIQTKHLKNMYGIHFDVLTNLRSFTAPSKFRSKSYEWIGNNFYNISSIQEFPEFPESLFDLIN